MKKYFFTVVFALASLISSGQELQNFRPRQVVSPEIVDGKVTFRIVACGNDDFLWEMAQNLDATLTRNGLEHTLYFSLRTLRFLCVLCGKNTFRR